MLLITLTFNYYAAYTYYEMWIHFSYSLYQRGHNSDGCAKVSGVLKGVSRNEEMGWPTGAIGQPKVGTLDRTASSIALELAMVKVSKGVFSH